VKLFYQCRFDSSELISEENKRYFPIKIGFFRNKLPAHRISQSSEARVPSSLLSRHPPSKLIFCGTMISRTENQEIFVKTRDQSIQIEPVPSFFRTFPEGSGCLQKARQKGEFFCGLCFFHYLR
jgi:hypothetical protein